MDNKRILEMIASMSRLTEDAGAFQGEASNAAAKIQELMEKYSISQMDVKNYIADKQEKEFTQVFTSVESEFKHKNIQEWEWSLARLIADITLTRFYATGRGMARYGVSARFVFFGSEQSTKLAAEFYALWHENIWKMAKRQQTLNVQRILKEYKMKDPLKHYAEDHPEDDPRYFRSSWISGCLNAMHTKVREERNAREKEAKKEEQSTKSDKSSVAIMLVDYKEALDKAYQIKLGPTMKSVKTGGSKGFSSSGYLKGQETGSKIKIGSKQLE